MDENQNIIPAERKTPDVLIKKKRPVKFSIEILDRLFLLWANSSKSLNNIMKENKDLPHERTFFKWQCRNDEIGDLIATRLAHARDKKADYLFDGMEEIAADVKKVKTITHLADGKRVVTISDNYNRSRLHIDTRKFIVSRLNPKKYGDKVEHTITEVKQITGMRIINEVQEAQVVNDEPKQLTD